METLKTPCPHALLLLLLLPIFLLFLLFPETCAEASSSPGAPGFVAVVGAGPRVVVDLDAHPRRHLAEVPLRTLLYL
jgi:hypothetical protein